MKYPVRRAKETRKTATVAVALAVAAVVSASGVASAADPLVIEPGSPKVMTEADCAVSYTTVTVLDNLTLDGANGNIQLQNNGNIVIGGNDAQSQVAVVITNGATWKAASSKTLTFTSRGGTLVVSSSIAPTYDMSTEMSKIGNLGPYLRLKNSQYILNAGKCELRLLPNGVTSFRSFENEAAKDVAMHLMFEGGANFIQALDNSSAALFQVVENGRTIIESVNGNPMLFKGFTWKSKFFSGAGTLETAGDGDFVFDADRAGDGIKALLELGKDVNGTVVWGHKGRTCLFGRSIWTVASDDILPHGTLPSGEARGPVVIGTGVSGSIWSTTLDLNGKTVSVNALLANETGKNVVTNSAATEATLGLDVPSANTNLSDVLTVTFSADADSTIKMRKVGAGALVVDAALPSVAGFDVAEGTLRIACNAAVSGSFLCDGALQVDSGATLDLSTIADSKLSISNLVVDLSTGAGTITKFRPAENGILSLVGVVGDLPGVYRVPVAISAIADSSNLASWKVFVNGEVLKRGSVMWESGQLKARTKTGMFIIIK